MPEIIWKQGAESDLLQIFAELEERSEARYKICPRITPINANESKIDFLFRVHSRDSWGAPDHLTSSYFGFCIRLLTSMRQARDTEPSWLKNRKAAEQCFFLLLYRSHDVVREPPTGECRVT
jgi:hypothetical protein